MEERNYYTIPLLILLLQVFWTVPSLAYYAVIKAQCTPLNLNHCYFKHCEMRTDANDQTFLHFHVAMRDKRPINDITINISAFKIGKTYRMPIFNETFDFCAFMRQGAVSKIFIFINHQFNRFTNANHSCPYQHDIIYYGVNKERFFSEIPAPKGEYILQMRVATNGTWKADVKFYAIQK